MAKIAVSGVAIFLVDFRIFWNVENTLPIRLKHSKFYSFMKTISLKQKRHVLRTFQFWPKSLYPDLTGVAIFLVDFRIFWNVENTLPIRLKHSKFYSFMKTISLKQKRHVLRTFQFWPKSLYQRGGHFFVDFRIFWNVENTLPIRLKHSKFYSFMKTISLKEKRHVLRTFQFWPKSLYPDLTGEAIFLVDFRIFWIIENTLPIRLKHSKFYSFMKTISLKQKLHVLRTFQFLPKSLYLGWPFFWLILGFFEMLKIPFQFVWNIQNYIL